MLSSEIIDRLGGTRNLSELLGVQQARVCNWLVRGITPNVAADIALVARALGHRDITAEVIARSRPPPGKGGRKPKLRSWRARRREAQQSAAASP